ncbi:Acetyl esterase/lipase [Formivibrio citricus]|uniref:Acetyl esterase/lipase n=1 Tax=Formivibrio citricus TaxID=83765 RepID=A0A1I5A6D3_9NEIS|nr:alpha/beta hydrolase [Formivibrio citricus]SFN58032.1 Acetyl esterase/lipase [Formivibrio citricus]
MKKIPPMFLLASVACISVACTVPSSNLPPLPEQGVMPTRPVKADTSWIKTQHLDVAYAKTSPSQKLDLYLPNEGAEPFPLIIEIHGGGFALGKKSGNIAPMLEGLKRGYAVASIDYRLSGEAKFPAAINDVKAAIRFLRANAAQYRLDSNRFATWGGSAGGNLSALAATSAGVAALTDPALGHADVSDAVQAAVDWFGPLDFTTMDAQFAAQGTSGVMGLTSSPNSFESRYLGKTVGTPEAQPLAALANPITHVGAKTPPMYIQHGAADRNVPITQSKQLAEKLVSTIGQDKVVFETLDAGHGGPKFDAPANAAKILDFLDKHLKR